MVGAYDGKDASKTGLEASAANCAVLPYTFRNLRMDSKLPTTPMIKPVTA